MHCTNRCLGTVRARGRWPQKNVQRSSRAIWRQNDRPGSGWNPLLLHRSCVCAEVCAGLLLFIQQFHRLRAFTFRSGEYAVHNSMAMLSVGSSIPPLYSSSSKLSPRQQNNPKNSTPQSILSSPLTHHASSSTPPVSELPCSVARPTGIDINPQLGHPIKSGHDSKGSGIVVRQPHAHAEAVS